MGGGREAGNEMASALNIWDVFVMIENLYYPSIYLPATRPRLAVLYALVAFALIDSYLIIEMRLCNTL